MRGISAFASDSSIGQDIRLDDRGSLALAVDLEDVRQRVIERLRWQLGEWFLQTQEGVPYRSRIFQVSTSAGLAAAVVTDQIRSERGVTAVRNVEAEIDFETRRMTYRAVVEAGDAGAFTLEESIG